MYVCVVCHCVCSVYVTLFISYLQKSASNQRYKLLSTFRCMGNEASDDMVRIYDAINEEMPLESDQ